MPQPQPEVSGTRGAASGRYGSSARGDPGVGLFERRGIVDGVAGHRDHLTGLPHEPGQPQLVLGGHPAEHVQSGQLAGHFGIGQVLQFGAGEQPRPAARAGSDAVPDGEGQAGPMTLAGLSTWVNRVIAWADGLQRRHGVLGFPYAVIKKYGDDAGGREAALITYYGFLSIFPLLLLGVAVLSRVLASHQALRERLVDAVVPQALRSTVEHSLATLPTSTIPFAIGLIGLLFSGTGVVFSVYQTLNHVAAVPHRFRANFFSRYVRVFVMLAVLLLGGLAVGALTVVATALPGQPGVKRAAAVAGSALVVFAVLLLAARLLLVRPAPVRALWPGAVLGAVVVTVVLNVGAPLLARLVAKAGPVYGSFATVAAMFALLYLVGQALVYVAEIAAVRYARLWPRAVDLTRPTAADARVLALLAREQERIPAARVDFRLTAPACPPVQGGSLPGDDGPG